ncbi:MAG: PAS domain-containing protein [Desulfobacterales bacterium]|nr:PAS domain-containing protein [Desulfobacterales bacterium]
MLNPATYEAILDSIPHRLVFVDSTHVIRYLNRAAKAWFYTKRGFSELVGQSLFACHKPESRDTILALYERLRQGEEAVFVKVTPEKEKASMIAVRDPDGNLIGYWERFEALAPEVPSTIG